MQTRTLGACAGPARPDVTTSENSSDTDEHAECYICGREADGVDARTGKPVCSRCARGRATRVIRGP
ncbi:hypothetical protein [Halosegnis longus]|uniref:hypothetical protein n=1 Tax=Halosegnis longus TaxID=2216012 RepID=UPI0011CD8404